MVNPPRWGVALISHAYTNHRELQLHTRHTHAVHAYRKQQCWNRYIFGNDTPPGGAMSYKHRNNSYREWCTKLWQYPMLSQWAMEPFHHLKLGFRHILLRLYITAIDRQCLDSWNHSKDNLWLATYMNALTNQAWDCDVHHGKQEVVSLHHVSPRRKIPPTVYPWHNAQQSVKAFEAF